MFVESIDVIVYIGIEQAMRFPVPGGLRAWDDELHVTVFVDRRHPEFPRCAALLVRSAEEVMEFGSSHAQSDSSLADQVGDGFPFLNHGSIKPHLFPERASREALRFTTARADREFLRRRLAVCRPDGGEPATE